MSDLTPVILDVASSNFLSDGGSAARIAVRVVLGLPSTFVLDGKGKCGRRVEQRESFGVLNVVDASEGGRCQVELSVAEFDGEV